MIRNFLLFLWMAGLFSSCSPKFSVPVLEEETTPLNKGSTRENEPDYSNLYYWAAHPYKHDPSDSVPAPLKHDYIQDSTVDVFFLHPTTLTSKDDTSWNAGITDDILNHKTDYSTILYQASVFNECRVFAPRYRQAHIRSYFPKDSTHAVQAFELAYADIKASFIYYLEHFNNGRPIIIAGHSQGSTHAQRLLKEFFENSVLKNRLVAAYVIGMYIPPDYFTDLKMCSDSLQTGCIVGWRTFKNGYQPGFVMNEKKQGWVTNPLTWTTTNEYAPFKLNRGAVIRNFNQVQPRITDARIHNGILWINRPHITGSVFLRMRNFHIGDINLYYINIRENVRRRIGVFWKR
jgi:hypothetical protein